MTQIQNNNITTYDKGSVKTRDLIPTSNLLGEGNEGSVFQHANHFNWVVKKSKTSLREEYLIGSMINHPNIVKTHKLFIKTYPSNPNIQKYKLVMEKIQGEHLNNFFEKKLPDATVKSLLEQARSCCLYLFDNQISWGDLHAENTYIDAKNGHLTIADLGFWHRQTTKSLDEQAIDLMNNASGMIKNILAVSNLTSPAKARFAGPFSNKSLKIMEVTPLTKYRLWGKNGEEIRKDLDQYFIKIIQNFSSIVI